MLQVTTNGDGYVRAEQSSFGIEEKVEHPVPLPDQVLRLLNEDNRVKGCLEDQKLATPAPGSWFIASEIHLHKAGQIDLVVLPEEGCLFGANIGPLWVFANGPGGYFLVFKTDALGIDILKSKTRGYRDIRGEQATAVQVLTRIFKFDGQAYNANGSARIHEEGFGIENTVDYPVSLPEQVVRLLNEDERVTKCLESGNLSTPAPASWFIASETHLHKASQADLVVQPEEGCLFGANIGPLWVFANGPSGYSLVFTTQALGIEILKPRTKGYRDIRGVSATAVEVLTRTYKFDGHSYQPR